MKNFYIIICGLLLVSCSKQKRKTDLELLEIRGKVRTIKETTFGCEQITGNCETEIKMLEEIYEFNELGNQTRDILNNLFQSETKVTEISFDKKNRPLKQDITTNVNGMAIKQELKYEWVSDFELKSSMIANGATTEYILEKFDEEYHLIGRKKYFINNGQEILIYEESNVYDTGGTWQTSAIKEKGKEEYLVSRKYDNKRKHRKLRNKKLRQHLK